MSSSRFDVISQLGTGHFTAGVYLAEHRDLGRQMAVKLLEVQAVTDRDALLEEARTMAALAAHPNVVQVFDAGDWDSDHVYIASEVCEGGSVEDLCSPGLDPAAACALVSGACRGLDFMHQEELVHLDIRPANILLRDDTPKLADFGLARWLTDAQVPNVYAAHAAPEMLLNYSGTMASDQYAMAMTLAHALTGGAVCTSPPSPITSGAWKGFPDLRSGLGLNVPERLVRVLVKATRFDAADRYSSIEEFKRAVDKATPEISFRISAPNEMASADGDWSIEWSSHRAGFSVDVRRHGRRTGELCERALGPQEWPAHVASVVNSLAGY